MFKSVEIQNVYEIWITKFRSGVIQNSWQNHIIILKRINLMTTYE